ncbi:MAG: response regulator, partial [Flavobacteriales bacterium]|nr:response regulator [Flavobacteriales bacterium]
ELQSIMYGDSLAVDPVELDQLKQEADSYGDVYLSMDAIQLLIGYQITREHNEAETIRLLNECLHMSNGLVRQYDFYNYLGILRMYGYDHGNMSFDLMTMITSIRLDLYKNLDIPVVRDKILQAELEIQLEQTQILADIKNDQMAKIEELALRRARQNRFLAALVVLLAIFITVLGVIFMRNKQLTSKLADAREKLSEHNQLLEQQVTERTRQLERKFEEFKEYSFLNSHKLRLPISQLESMMEAYKESGDIKYLENLPRLMDQTMLVIGEINDSLNPTGEHKAREIPSLTINDVVFIDDDLLQNMANEVILKKVRPDIQVTTFQNPVEALEQLDSKQVKADLIFLDIQMPEMDGFDVLGQLQSREILTPVVMLSSSLRNDDKKKAFQCQLVLDYVEKPLRKDWLKKLFQVG